METNEKLEKGIGDKEAEILKPEKVKIVEIGLQEVKFGSKTAEKVMLSCKHPQRDNPIIISQVKVLKKDKVKKSGLWFNEDEDGNIQKGSALAEFLIYAGVEKPSQLKDKEFETVADDDGFLVLKAY